MGHVSHGVGSLERELGVSARWALPLLRVQRGVCQFGGG